MKNLLELNSLKLVTVGVSEMDALSIAVWPAATSLFTDYSQPLSGTAPPNLGLVIVQLRQAANRMIDALDEHKQMTSRLDAGDAANSTVSDALAFAFGIHQSYPCYSSSTDSVTSLT